MTSRRGLLGAAVLAAYVIAAVATVRLTDHHVRPLFEGIGPAPRYQWVDPPPEFATGNVKPHAVTRELPLTDKGSSLTSLSSGDAQVVLNLADGAVPAKPGDTAAAVTFAPFAPNELGPPPPGLRADGNAYRIAFAYKPSGQSLTTTAPPPGSFIMALPEPGVTLLWSADGKRWERLATQPVGGPTSLATQFTRAGYYLGAASPTTEDKPSSTGRVIAVIAIVVGIALALGFGPVLVRRLRRPKTRSEQRRKDRGRK